MLQDPKAIKNIPFSDIKIHIKSEKRAKEKKRVVRDSTRLVLKEN